MLVKCRLKKKWKSFKAGHHVLYDDAEARKIPDVMEIIQDKDSKPPKQ